MTANKFTFKKEKKETGLASVGNTNPNTVIKLNKLEVGFIYGPNWQSKDNLWGVRLMKKGLENDWQWTKLKAKFDNEPAAREFLNQNFQKIVDIGLHQEND